MYSTFFTESDPSALDIYYLIEQIWFKASKNQFCLSFLYPNVITPINNIRGRITNPLQKLVT